MDTINLIHGDCLQEMKKLESESIDCILTDPPYKYLKHKLDRDWDEDVFFNEAKRVLKQDGFIVLFGRGTSFYRWNTILDDLGFKFKEEVVWDKRRITAPALPLGRRHETISIYGKGRGKINKSTVKYLDIKSYEPKQIINDIKRIEATLRNKNLLQHICLGLEKNEIIEDFYYPESKKLGHKTTVSSRGKYKDVGIHTLKTMHENKHKETDIIKDFGCKYNSIHPTQKPVKLLIRLLKLTTKEGDTILDPFAGSASTAVACANTSRKFIGYEIDKEYFEAASKRLQPIKQRLF